MHGLGDSADGGWREVMSEVQQQFKGLKVILPNAPHQPVTLNGGMRMPSWHDIKSLSGLDREEFHGIDQSRETIQTLLNEEIKSGTPSSKIILGGFSQGAAMSLFTGLQFDQSLGGIVALSGYLPYTKGDFKTLMHEANKKTPLLMCHGESDPVVRFEIGQKSFKALEAAGKESMEFKSYKYVGHHTNDDEMSDIMSWVKKVLG